MPIKVLSWNMYYGNSGAQPQFNGGNTTPVQRFNEIAHRANQYQIDAVFLQEHPGVTSGFTDPNGYLNGAIIPAGYQYYIFREMDQNVNNRVSQSNKSYALIIKNTCVLGNVFYYNQNHFNNGISYMRCPVGYIITNNNITYSFLHWHNEVGNNANTGMTILAQLLNNQLPNNTVIVGDLNVNDLQIGNYNFFNPWNDVVHNSNVHRGVDHILTPINIANPLHLPFISDANHYPIQTDIN